MKSRRKWAWLVAVVTVVVLVTFVFSLWGCAPAEQEVFKLKLASEYGGPDELTLCPEEGGETIAISCGFYREMCQEIYERTNGGLDIEVFMPGTLVKGMPETLPALKSGLIDMTVSYGSAFTSVVPLAMVEPGFPCGSTSFEDTYNLWAETDWLEIVREAYAEAGLYFLGIPAAGTTVIISNFPVYLPSDLDGKLFGAYAIVADMVKEAGGTPTYISYTELYTALQRGTVDGTTYGLAQLESMNLWEVVSYVTTGFWNYTINWVIEGAVWDALPKEYQQVMNDVMAEGFYEASHYTYPSRERCVLIEAPEHNVTVHMLTPEELQVWRAFVSPLLENYATDPFSARLIDLEKQYFGFE